MISWIITLGLLGCVTSTPQSGYNYNTNRNQQYNQLNVQPLQPRQQQQLNAPQKAYATQAKNIVPITSYTNDVSHDGSYSYSYTSGDGTQQQAQGYLKNAGNKDLEAQVVQGSYSYISPEGIPISVTYIADENGFRAEGNHLPTPPPIPEAIAKSLQLIAQTQPVGAGFNSQYNTQQYSNNQPSNNYNNNNSNKYGRY